MANETEVLIVNGVEYTLIDSTAVHTVDSAISSSSTNPVQNKVIKAALDKKGTLISLSTATATALLDYYSFSVPAADITAINAAHDGVIISFGSSSAFGANETFVGFLNETTLWNGISYLAYSGTISAATSLDSNLFVLLLPKTGNGGTGYIKAKNVATKGDVGDALDDAEDYADTKIVAAIEALDAAVSGLGTGKTITALSETNGVISATASNIAIAGSQVTSGTIAAERLPSTVVKKSDELQTTNPFAPGPLRGPYISKIDNAFYAAPKRWTVTSTPTGSVDPLFNGDYESVRVIAAGTSCTFNLKFDTESNGYFPGYPYGYILVSFYFQNIPASVTGRAYCNYESHGIGWHDIDFSVVPESNVSNAVYRGRQAWYNISEIEITVTADASKSANITQIEMHLDRPNSARNPFLSKYAAETLYYGLTAPSFTGNLRGELNYGTCATAAGTAAKVVTCTGFVLVAGARISVKFTNGSTSTGTMQLNVNGTGVKNCGIYVYNGSWVNCANRCNKNEVLEFVYDGTYWVTITPYTLRNYGNYSSRLTSANVSFADFGLQYFLATSAMTTGKPPTDAAILNMNWDNGTIWGTQLAVGLGHGRVFTRAQNGSSAWGDWKEIPRLSSSLTNGQIVISDESTGNALLKGGPALDATDTTKFLRHDGSWAEVGGGVAPVEDSDVFLSRAVNFGENKYKFPSLVGGSVAWNQLITASDKSKTTTPNGTATYSFTSVSCSIRANHIYIIGCDITYNGTLNPLRLYVQIGSVYGKPAIDATSANKRADWLIKPTANSTALTVGVSNVATSAKLTSADAWSYNNLTVIDLTLALTPTIADYIYSLETATTGAGVAWFKQYFPKSYYPYNAGALVSVNPTGAETIGVNLFDESIFSSSSIPYDGEWWGANAGVFFSATNNVGWEQVNYLPEQSYYAQVSLIVGTTSRVYLQAIYTDGTTTNGSDVSAGNSGISRLTTTAGKTVQFIRITYGSNPNYPLKVKELIINISNPLYNGTYYPYTHHSYPISPVELRGIPKLTDGKLAFDGDARASDGTVTRKYGIVDLGTRTWNKYNNGFWANIDGAKRPADSTTVANAICSKYRTDTLTHVISEDVDKIIAINDGNSRVNAYDSTYSSSTAAQFKTAMSGVYLIYELATPTTESSEALPVPQVVYDGGTESYIDERDVQVPVGQDATYMDATSAIGELMESGLVPSNSGVSQASGTFVLGGTGTTITSQWNYVKTGKEVTIYGGFANWMSSSTMTTLFGLPFKPAYSTPVHLSCYVLNVGKFDVVMKLNTDKTMTVECATLIGTNGTVTYIPVPSSTFAYYLIYLTAEIRYITNE